MDLNIVQADISQRLCFTSALYQWDYGQILLPTGVELPSAYEVHFAVPNTDTTMTVIGNADGVAIPDELLQSAGQIVAYIYLHSGEDDGETEYKINIPVKARPQPSDYEPTPVQQDVITQTIGAVQSAMNAWQNMTAEAVTLQPDEEATASYANGVLTLGIPKGEKGDSGTGGGSVESVNGQTGVVTLTASDVGALPSTTVIPSKTSQLQNDSGFLTSAPVTSVNSKTGSVVLNASDVGAISTEVDPTVPSWAKQPNKPTYTASEVGALPNTTVIPSKTSELTNDSGFLTSAPVQSVNGMTGAVVISTATTSADGLLSATDKGRLDALYEDYSSAMTALGV